MSRVFFAVFAGAIARRTELILPHPMNPADPALGQRQSHNSPLAPVGAEPAGVTRHRCGGESEPR